MWKKGAGCLILWQRRLCTSADPVKTKWSSSLSGLYADVLREALLELHGKGRPEWTWTEQFIGDIGSFAARVRSALDSVSPQRRTMPLTLTDKITGPLLRECLDHIAAALSRNELANAGKSLGLDPLGVALPRWLR